MKFRAQTGSPEKFFEVEPKNSAPKIHWRDLLRKRSDYKEEQIPPRREEAKGS